MTNRCYYLTKDHRLFIREKEMPVPAEGEVIIRPMANSICGSDIRMYTLAHMGKSYIREDRPISMGHECSGIITELGNGVTGLKIGQHVVIEPGIYCRRCHNCMTGRYNICDTFNFTSGTDPDDERIDGAAMITKRFTFEELSEAFRYTADNPKKCIKTVIIHDT